MAPESSNQKRKRGRPSNASRDEAGAGAAQPRKSNPKAASTGARETDEDVDANPRALKRSRPETNQEQLLPEHGRVRRSTRERRSTDDHPWWISDSNDASPSVNAVAQEESAGEVEIGRSSKTTGRLVAARRSLEEPARRSPRERRSADEQPWWKASAENSAPQEAEAQASSQRTKKKTGRPPRSSDTSAAMSEIDPNASGESSSLRRSRRERYSADERPWWQNEPAQESHGPVEESSPERLPSGQSSRLRAAPAKLSPAGRRARGRQSLNSQPGASELKAGKGKSVQAETVSAASAPLRSGKRPHTTTADGQTAALRPKTLPTPRRRSVGVIAEEAPEHQGRQRRSSKAGNEAHGADKRARPAPKYRRLVPKTRKVPQAVMASKWGALDTASIAAAEKLITDTYHPVLQRLHDRDKRYEQAQKILRVMTTRLKSKMAKGIRFPPPSAKSGTGRAGTMIGSHEDEFNFEKTVDAIQALQTTLDPLLHSITLLRSEKEKEEAALEKDFEALRELEANAKAEVRSWREREKRAHVLAPEPMREEDLARGREDGLELVKTKVPASGVFQDLPDDEVKALALQLGSHMESMNGNLQQIDGISPGIVQSKAALQTVLLKYLDPDQYTQTVLG